MIAGQHVKLISHGDVVIQRRLVSIDNGIYFVCKEEEFSRASLENREPVCIGFREEYVLKKK